MYCFFRSPSVLETHQRPFLKPTPTVLKLIGDQLFNSSESNFKMLSYRF